MFSVNYIIHLYFTDDCNNTYLYSSYNTPWLELVV